MKTDISPPILPAAAILRKTATLWLGEIDVALAVVVAYTSLPPMNRSWP